jgi:hypothetical protein
MFAPRKRSLSNPEILVKIAPGPADTCPMQFEEQHTCTAPQNLREVMLGLISLTIIALVVIRFSATVYNAGQVVAFFYLAATLHT